MARPLQVLARSIPLVGVAIAISACGTQKISVPKSQPAAYSGAELFAQRCAGCHSLNYAGTHGSAPNARTREAINGPNFNVRCERPITRVLYAIENGGFSGAYMPQNIVVGQDAREVAQFVAQYAGRLAPKQPGTTPCIQQPVGTLPQPGNPTAPQTSTTNTTPPTTSTPTPQSTPPSPNGSGSGSTKSSKSSKASKKKK